MTFHVDEISSTISLGYKVKKGIFNKVADMLSRPIISASILLRNDSIVHESYIEKYVSNADFQDVYASLSEGNQVEENDYHMHNNLLFHLGKMCIPQGERLSVMRETHSSLIIGNFIPITPTKAS